MEGGRQLGFEFISRDRTTITIRMLGDEVRYLARIAVLTLKYVHACTAGVQGRSMHCWTLPHPLHVREAACKADAVACQDEFLVTAIMHCKP